MHGSRGSRFLRPRTPRGMVNSTPEFADHPAVINGCSDLFIAVFGEAGNHARSALGMNSLPYQITVELEALFEIATESET